MNDISSCLVLTQTAAYWGVMLFCGGHLLKLHFEQDVILLFIRPQNPRHLTNRRS